MPGRAEDVGKDKISPQFASRLMRLGPRDVIRAILLLRAEGLGTQPKGRRSATRSADVANLRKSAGAALADIDKSLKRSGGRRLADSPNALGSIPVETTAAGIIALAASEHVKSILEDQAISSLKSD